MPRLFWVTDDEVVARPDFVERAGRAVEACGHTCALQLRAHGLAGREVWRLAERLKAITDAAGASLLINDRVDVALAVRAHGVQLGRRSIPAEEARRVLGRACWIACSAHSGEEVAASFEVGADLVVLGHVYPTGSHADRPPLGLGALREAASVARPIVAIGGISDDRIKEVIEAGAWGVAVKSGLWEATDVSATARRYLSALGQAVRSDDLGAVEVGT